MSDETSQSPKISIKLDISPTTWHCSNRTPPTLTLTITSHASRTLTTSIPYGSPLQLKSAMGQGGFPITDLTTSPPTPVSITDLTGRINRYPSQPDLLTLHPKEPVVFSVAFTRGGFYAPEFQPQPFDVVQTSKVVDHNGKELPARQSKTASGVDGLEPGKRHKVTVAKGKLMGTRWWWGTKEEVQSGIATTPTFEEDDELPGLPLEFDAEGGGVEFCVEQ